MLWKINSKGGRAQVLNYLLNDLFQEDDTKNSTVSAPTVEEVSNPDNSDEQQQRDDILRQAREQQDYDLSLQIAMGTGRGNPYNDEENPPSLGSKVGNPYTPTSKISNVKGINPYINPQASDIFSSIAGTTNLGCFSSALG